MNGCAPARSRRSLDLRLRGVESTVANIVSDRATEEVRLLQDDAEVRLIPPQAALAIVDAVNQDASFRGFVKAPQQIDERRFAAAGGAHQRNRLAWLDDQIKADDDLRAVAIAKTDIFKLDPPNPIGVSVAAAFPQTRRDPRAVENLGNRFHQAETRSADACAICISANQADISCTGAKNNCA